MIGNKEVRTARVRRKHREAHDLIIWPDGKNSAAGFFWKNRVVPDRRCNVDRRKIPGTIEDRVSR